MEVKNASYGSDGGVWGTVSDENFGIGEANVACRAAGFGTASYVQTGAHYGRGIGPVHLRNVWYVISGTTLQKNILHL